MSSRWGEDIDEELQQQKGQRKAHITLNFRAMSQMVTAIEEEAREWDSKYPRNEFLKIWGCAMFAYFVCAILSYKVFWVISAPMYIFYGTVILHIGKVWKRFGYARWKYWLMTLLGVLAVLLAGFAVQYMIFEK